MVITVAFGQFRRAPVHFFDIDSLNKGYRIVFASICEHVSSAFIFASTSSDQVGHASREHFRI